jgi:hypothetical protein
VFLEDYQIAGLVIKRMIFHLVGPHAEDFVRLEELHPGPFAGFFLDRIRSINGGAEYSFSDASASRERLYRIATTENSFQEESEKLAEDFQRLHGGTTAAGAFLVFVLNAADEQVFALLKYDDETVLTYEVEEGEAGRKRVTLDTLERTFVQNRAALQKAALIRLTDTGGDLLVMDRQNPQKVARYFENFLDAVRIYEDSELTERLVQVTRDVIRSNRDLVPPDVYSQVTQRTFNAASAGGAINVDGHRGFLENVMGQQLPDNHPILPKFFSGLKRVRLDGTPITLDATKVSRPSSRRIVTVNNIQIRVPIDVEAFIQIESQRIIINDQIKNQYDDTEQIG